MWENFKNQKLKCWKNRIESVKNKIKKIKKWKNKNIINNTKRKDKKICTT